MIITQKDLTEKLSELAKEIKLLADKNTVCVEFLSKDRYKGYRRSELIYNLLDCYRSSGLMPFDSYEAMQYHYKKAVGLISGFYDDSVINDYTKNTVWQAVDNLPLQTTQKLEVLELLNGRVIKELSWTLATQKQFEDAVKMITDDMTSAGVQDTDEGSRYKELLKTTPSCEG